MLSKPVAVLISDVHYGVHTLVLADAVVRMAIDKANELRVPLIVAGDLHDTKANMRGECVNTLIETFKQCDSPPYILVGNHDRLNEKSPEHALNFLAPYAMLISHSVRQKFGYLIPYHHDPEELRAYLKTLPKGARLIMHQGLEKTNSGHYIQDKSALRHEDVAGFRIISGHYHTRQTIDLPDGGTWDYIGSPYTLNYGEANDPPKGFQILMDDGTLTFVPTNLRKHVIWNEIIGQQIDQPSVSEDDLLWIKMHGTREQLVGFTKSSIPLKMPFKLDLISLNTTPSVPQIPKLNQESLLDSLIDSLTNTSDERKLRLKDKWKNYANN